jgi:heme/copper-type cytochrome/quinol oxidase subunit 3
MRERVVADFSGLPPHGMHTASPTWWGTLAFMLIEGTGFALAIAVYLYLMSLATTWPINSPRPNLLPGTLVTLVLVGSVVPNYLISRWAEQQDAIQTNLVVNTDRRTYLIELRSREKSYMPSVAWFYPDHRASH